jgi:hypothetical protein
MSPTCTQRKVRAPRIAVAEYEHELITCVDMPEEDFTVPIESPGDSRITTDTAARSQAQLTNEFQPAAGGIDVQIVSLMQESGRVL